ncbi:hypothetical protein P8C59_001317 [Phyllachora maydis]|uniref:Uncharacterized protein n=1 Tax=Phyllachora maydis TaxID=1825666 RepID=A0AAD9M8X7_9PEZI|nr:hypothetical protein P8C59_001317 [Phyllachora maydis]
MDPHTSNGKAQPVGVAQKWNPRMLLDPRGAALASSQLRQQVTPTPPARSNTMPPQTDHLAYVFISDNHHVVNMTQAEAARDEELATTALAQSGCGRHIEQMNNVQDRSQIREPKRRKTEADSDGPTHNRSFGGGGGGLLGNHCKAQHEQAARYSPNQPLLPVKQEFHASAQQTVDLTEAETEPEAMEIEEIPPQVIRDEEVCYGMVQGASINCHKVPAPKPGMIAIGGDGYWPQVKVVLRRKANEASHLITVYDCTRQVFGAVDAKIAQVLAPLLDSALQVRTDCRIPSRRKVPGEQVGQQISYGTESHGTYTHLPPVVRTAEEVRSEVVTVFDSLPKSENLPEEDPDPRITTELLKHQRQALYFMTTREKDKIPDDRQGTQTSSSWQRRRDQYGAEYYYNVVTDQQQHERPPPTRGGILADMMGLGKTLSVLALITKTLGEASEWSARPPTQPREPPPRKPTQGPMHFDVPKAPGLGLTPLRQNGRGTLLICPLSTITNWEEQIKQHVRENSLSVIVYHGSNRVRNHQTLAQVDLVITTYGSVSSELTARSRGKKGPFPLEEIGWFRIVLDEAHIIREQNTLAFKSICRLQAERRWAVTGTPIQNRLEDLGSLLSFLRLSPFHDKAKFIQYVITPFKNADPEIVPKLRVLVDTITLRRLKDKIDLPPRKDLIVKLQFTPEERRIYDPFNRNAIDRLTALTGRNDRMQGKTYIHILRAILRLRLICAHGKDLLNEEDLQFLEGTSASTAIELDSDDDEKQQALAEGKAYDMFYVMQETGQDICRRCNNKLGNESHDAADVESERQEDVLGYMASCLHLYCSSCASTLGRAAKHGTDPDSDTDCDTCVRFAKSKCVEIRRSRAAAEHETHDNFKSLVKGRGNNKAVPERYSGPHTKTRALVQELLKAKAKSAENPDEPPYKSVVFSGWTSHLDLIEIALHDAGITFTRLDGKMTRTQRTQAMDDFRDNPDVQVILVSIMAGGLGLNLTTGNAVYVMEPQFNPAAEAQAVDRVHRLGQKREVTTVRFIMEDSFEEKMMQLQEKKNKLASLSMDSRDKDKIMDRTESAKQRLLDLRSLFR